MKVRSEADLAGAWAISINSKSIAGTGQRIGIHTDLRCMFKSERTLAIRGSIFESPSSISQRCSYVSSRWIHRKTCVRTGRRRNATSHAKLRTHMTSNKHLHPMNLVVLSQVQ
jgi:hypothetical protein